LGASRGRLVRQTLTESVLLGFLGGAFGVVLAGWLLRIFIAIAPQGIPRLSESGLNLRVLVFAIGASAISALLFGIVPALRSPSGETLTGGHSVDARSGLLRQSLATAQIAVSLVLLTAASLLLQSFRNVEAVPLGMQSEHVLTASMSLGDADYPKPEQRQSFFEELETRLSAMPGADAVALSDTLPPNGAMHAKPYNALEVYGEPRQNDEAGGMVGWRIVTPGYFSALRIPIVRGRGFKEADRAANDYLIVLSQTLARRLLGNRDALGKQIRLEPSGFWYSVIGVAGNVKNGGVLAEDDPEYYVVRKHDIGPRRAAINHRNSIGVRA
ncbi:MAG: ABC transporter permease, partial [Candidatus Acidiferrales bacterium]